jgi:hypothetical protein
MRTSQSEKLPANNRTIGEHQNHLATLLSAQHVDHCSGRISNINHFFGRGLSFSFWFSGNHVGGIQGEIRIVGNLSFSALSSTL